MTPRHAHAQFTAPDFPAVERERSRFKHAGLAPLTVVSYERDWRVFRAWCGAAGRTALPASADTVELYVTDLIGRGRKVTTVQRHAVGIQYQHRQAGYASPCGAGLRELLGGARRVLCQMPRQKEALQTAELARMAQAIGSDSPIAARNAAIVLFGFASALRRSNLARLRREDLTFTRQGVLVAVRGEKQDRKGKGRTLAVLAGKHAETCPVRALRRWLKYRGDGFGPLFCRVLRGHPNGKPLLANRITQIVQDAVRGIGLDARLYGAHSLRAGFVTEALEKGANEIAIARHTGHRDLTTLRRYFRGKSLFKGNAGAALGL